MRKTHDYTYEYRGIWRDGGRCRIEIYAPEAGEAGCRPVIVATERDDNAGSSVTNLAALARRPAPHAAARRHARRHGPHRGCLTTRSGDATIPSGDISANGLLREGGMAPGLEEFGRFTEPALLILISLADGAKHGYAMLEDIERLCGLRMGPGTLYGALARLEARGLIAALPATARRHPYRLTAVGARLLGARLGEVQHVATVGLRRLAAACAG